MGAVAPVAPPPSPFDELAATVRASRAEFEQTYDGVRKRQHPDGDAFKMVARGMADDRAAFAAAFAAAEGEGWSRSLLEALIDARFADAQTTAPPTIEAVRDIAEGWTDETRGLLRPQMLNLGVLRAMRQVCRVRVDVARPSTGTGFLVGPQAVLTCYHVVKPLLDAAGRPTAGSFKQLSVEFDVLDRGTPLRLGVCVDWLVSASPCLEGEAPVEGYGRLPPLAHLSAQTLDFAVVRLAGTPGRERGFRQLDAGRWPSPSKRIFLFQHPGQFPQRVGDSSDTAWHDPVTKLRYKHRANTSKGSSGGLCVDETFEVVALHQCAMVGDSGRPEWGGSVPTAHIATQPTLEAVAMVLPEFDPVWRLSSSGDPVLGRRRLQSSITVVAEGKTKRILVVRGAARSGKSFTLAILRERLPEGQHAIVPIAAADVPPIAADLAAMILKTIERQDSSGGPLPPPSQTATTDTAYLTDELFPAFKTRLEAAVNGRLVWLVLHDLEHTALPETAARRFLEVLYARVAMVPSLRIVLVGLAGSVPGADGRLVEEEYIDQLVEGDVETWLQRFAVANSIELGQGEAARWAKQAVRQANLVPNDRVATLARWIVAEIVPALSEST